MPPTALCFAGLDTFILNNVVKYRGAEDSLDDTSRQNGHRILFIDVLEKEAKTSWAASRHASSTRSAAPTARASHWGMTIVTTFILIPGGWQGGWVYQKVADLLTARGHKALPITLSGLRDVPAPTANLDTHIADVVAVVKSQRDDLVVVGQSYGGMIVSGVADAAPSHIRALVYVDAYVPDSGDSVWSLTTPRFRDLFVTGAKADGLSCAPPPHLDPRCRPHPMATFLQSIVLTGRWRDVPRKTYVGAFGWDGSPFRDLYERLSRDPHWSTHALDCGHNVARLKPEALTEILLADA